MRYNIVKQKAFIVINKSLIGGKYSFEEIQSILGEYNYIYKKSHNFRETELNREYSSFFASKEKIIEQDILDYFNNVGVFRYFDNPNNYIKLYKIKDKIELL